MIQPYQQEIINRMMDGNVTFIEFPRRIGRTFKTRNVTDAVLRRAHILSLASSNPPVCPKPPVTKQATVVPIKRGFVAAPSLTGGTTVATPITDGGDDV